MVVGAGWAGLEGTANVLPHIRIVLYHQNDVLFMISRLFDNFFPFLPRFEFFFFIFFYIKGRNREFFRRGK